MITTRQQSQHYSNNNHANAQSWRYEIYRVDSTLVLFDGSRDVLFVRS